MNTVMSRMRGKLLGLAGGLLLLMATGVVQAGTVTYVYTDPQGTPLAEADVNGNITATFDYAPYGSIALGTAPNGPGYTGHVNDPDTGLVYMQARYYDPGVGRFLSVDPVAPSAGNAFNFNRYAYASNNPIINTDPNGRDSVGENIDENAQASADAGDKAATFGWSFAGVLWKALGAESVSQVADKGKDASASDKVMAVITIVTLGKGEEAATVAKDVEQEGEDIVKDAFTGQGGVKGAVKEFEHDSGQEINTGKEGVRVKIRDNGERVEMHDSTGKNPAVAKGTRTIKVQDQSGKVIKTTRYPEPKQPQETQ